MRTPSRVEARQDWHYTDLDTEILNDARSGRCVILFDLSNEGPAYDAATFLQLYDWIEANDIPAQRCVWLAQNRAVEQAAKDHVGERAGLIRFDYYDYFVKLIAWEFSPSCRQNIPGADPGAFTERLTDRARKRSLLLCLNATPRLPRVLTVAALHYYQLIAESIVSFPGLNYVKQGASWAEVMEFVTRNPTLEYLRSSLDYIANMPELKVDNYDEKGNALVTKIDASVYERSYFSVVTESDFSDGRIDRVTEKLTKAYCMGHPALLVGNPNSIRFMTTFGFQDWDKVLDRSTELEIDSAARFQVVMRDLLKQVSRIRDDKDRWLQSVSEVTAYNIDHAVSGKFASNYVSTVEENVVDGLARAIAS